MLNVQFEFFALDRYEADGLRTRSPSDAEEVIEEKKDNYVVVKIRIQHTVFLPVYRFL